MAVCDASTWWCTNNKCKCGWCHLCTEITPIWWMSAHILLLLFFDHGHQPAGKRHDDHCQRPRPTTVAADDRGQQRPRPTTTTAADDRGQQHTANDQWQEDDGCTNNSCKYCSSHMCRDQTNLMNVCSQMVFIDDNTRWPATWPATRRSTEWRECVLPQQVDARGQLWKEHHRLVCFVGQCILTTGKEGGRTSWRKRNLSSWILSSEV